MYEGMVGTSGLMVVCGQEMMRCTRWVHWYVGGFVTFLKEIQVMQRHHGLGGGVVVLAPKRQEVSFNS